jgi:hypothetical protein
MTRHIILRILIGSGAILVAIGCGDAGQTANDVSPADAGAGLEGELRLACESACDSIHACPGRFATIDCADDCVAAYPADISGECTGAQIDLLNCRSGLSCAASPFDAECGEAVSAARASCGDMGLEAEIVEVSGTEVVVEIGDHSWSDSDESATESTDETEDDAPEVTDVHEPVVVTEIPGAVEVIDF